MGQFHWKIEGKVWQSTDGNRADIHPEERKHGSQSLQHFQ